ncbi:MAG: ubiquinol-cytochrome c reductase iron-sulfur subunit [Terriglobales bacterium]
MKIAKLWHKASPPAADAGAAQGRRSFLRQLGLGALVAGLAGQAWALLRSLVPNVVYEEPLRFKAGAPQSFPPGVTFLEAQRVFITREQDGLHAISAVCTHLGCTVKAVNLNQPRRVQIKGKTVEVTREFHCPCHGSKYYGDGSNYAGPAPRPLPSLKLEVAPDDGQLVVDMGQMVNPDFRLKA